MADYAGEIGEEAFKALVLRYTNCREEQFAHLEDLDYELADFVVLNPDGSYKVAFDVKNMNPSIEHLDREGDMTTLEKRQERRIVWGVRFIQSTCSRCHLSRWTGMRFVG